MDDIGAMLAESRESSGVSLEEASKDLDIKLEILENIEDGRIGAFTDIYELKEYLIDYARYLGLDEKVVVDGFNSYIFEYTSKIPVKEIEKVIEQQKNQDKLESIVSPYTKPKKKYNNIVYAFIYVAIFAFVIFAIAWSVKQVTVNRNVTNIISYGGK